MNKHSPSKSSSGLDTGAAVQVSKHTPGPWSITRKAHSGGVQLEIEAAPGNILKNRLIAVAWPQNDTDYANAQVAACGPELLESLELMVEVIRYYPAGDWDPDHLPAIERARATIAKARGE